MGRSLRIFTIRSRDDHPVMFWQDYGCVCPSLWTTNGSIPYVARLVSQWRCYQPEAFTIVDSILPAGVDYSDEQALRLALVDAWTQFK